LVNSECPGRVDSPQTIGLSFLARMASELFCGVCGPVEAVPFQSREFFRNRDLPLMIIRFEPEMTGKYRSVLLLME
jgi:hypothetical protein